MKRLLSVVLVTILCLSVFTIAAHAYDPIVDPYTIETLKAAQPDDVLHVIVDRFYVKDEKMEAMPSWPDLGAARKEFSAFVTEQNNLLIEEMKQVAEFDVRYVDLTVGRIHINIAAKEVEKLKNIEKISDIYVSIDFDFEPLSPTTPTTDTAQAYDPIVDPNTIEALKNAQPDDILNIRVERFRVEGEDIEKMPSWPNRDAARKEMRTFISEQNNLLIEEMKQVADFEVEPLQFSHYIFINIAAKDVEKLKALEKIADIRVAENGVLEPQNPTTPTEKVSGDADKDDELTVLDATAIQRYMAGLIDEEKIDLSSADFDKDDEVTILDATAIQRHLAGLVTTP